MSHLSDFIAMDFETAIRSLGSANAIGLVKFGSFKPQASFLFAKSRKLIQTADGEESHEHLLDKYCMIWYDSRKIGGVL